MARGRVGMMVSGKYEFSGDELAKKAAALVEKESDTFDFDTDEQIKFTFGLLSGIALATGLRGADLAREMAELADLDEDETDLDTYKKYSRAIDAASLVVDFI